MRKNLVHIRGVVVSLACLVIGILDLIPTLPQWAWITIGAVGLIVDALYYALTRRREQTTPEETPANGEPFL